MSDDILRQLYDGELYPAEEIKVPSKEFRECTRSHGRNVTQFKEQLTEEQRQEFEQIEQTRLHIENEYDIANFKKGFQLGMQMTLAGLEIPYLNKLSEE